jgi:hypothetical protein
MENIKTAKGATGILIFLLVLNILNMVDRTLITSFGTSIIADLNLSDSQFGLLTGPVFVFFYSIMGLFMGALSASPTVNCCRSCTVECPNCLVRCG